MKQIVDFKQSQRLDSVGICIGRVEDSMEHGEHHFPTIGELIEWIDENGKGDMSINHFNLEPIWEVDMIRGVEQAESLELIDALVELAIKIALNGQVIDPDGLVEKIRDAWTPDKEDNLEKEAADE